jgi:hypothetical protein
LSTAGLFFLGLFSAGVFLALFRHAAFGVATYVLVQFFSPADRWWAHGFIGETRWSLIAAAVTFIALVLHRPERQPQPVVRQGFFIGLLVFVGWLYLQSIWALDSEAHAEFSGYFSKYVLAILMMYWAMDRPESVRIFMWAYLAGCTYIAWASMAQFQGGRLDSFWWLGHQ